jgi:hypothetical protein
MHAMTMSTVSAVSAAVAIVVVVWMGVRSKTAVGSLIAVAEGRERPLRASLYRCPQRTARRERRKGGAEGRRRPRLGLDKRAHRAAQHRSMTDAISKGMARLFKYTPRHSKTDVEKKYKIGKDLGSGNFAVVKLAHHRDDPKQRFAVKVIDKKMCAGKESMIETEVAILRKVHHKNIVAMYEEFDTPDKLYLVLQLYVRVSAMAPFSWCIFAQRRRRGAL